MKLFAPIALAAALFVSPVVAHAGLMAIDFTMNSSIGGKVTGSGTAFTDSSHLDAFDYTANPADLIALNLSLLGIVGAPASTSFNKDDLNGVEWVLNVNGLGMVCTTR